MCIRTGVDDEAPRERGRRRGSQGELTDGEADVGCTTKVAGAGAVHRRGVIFIEGACTPYLHFWEWFGLVGGWYRYRKLTKGIGTPAARSGGMVEICQEFCFWKVHRKSRSPSIQAVDNIMRK